MVKRSDTSVLLNKMIPLSTRGSKSTGSVFVLFSMQRSFTVKRGKQYYYRMLEQSATIFHVAIEQRPNSSFILEVNTLAVLKGNQEVNRK